MASELFMAGKTPEEGIESAIKDSSLNGSLESLEHDQQQHQVSLNKLIKRCSDGRAVRADVGSQ